MFINSSKKEDYMATFNRVINHFKEQIPTGAQTTPHLAAMLTGPSGPSMQGQMSQAQMGQGQMTQGQMSQGQMGQNQMSQGQINPGQMNQGQMTQGQMTQGQMTQGQMAQGQMTQGQMGQAQMQMGGQMGQQQSQMGQNNQMGNQQMGQVGPMSNTLGQGNSQLGQGQLIGHGNQGMGGMTGMGQQMTMGGVPVSHGQGMGMGGQGNQMNPSQAAQMGMNRMGNPVLGQMNMVGQNASNMGMTGGQVISNTNPGMLGPGMPRMTPTIGMPGQGGDMSWQGGMNMGGMKPGMSNMPMPGKMGPLSMSMGGQGGPMTVGINRGGVTVSGGSGNMQPRIPSPSYSGTPGGGIPIQNIPSSVSIASPGMVQSQPQMMVPQHSPAFISPSPSSQMVPSPVGSGGRGTMMGAPSPSTSMVNTPGQPMQPSPSATNQMEEKAYLDKVKHLQKYVEPLKAIIANNGNEERKINETQKIKKVLDILQNPYRRMPMETLERCEKVLLILENHHDMSQPVHKESAVDVLMEGIRSALKAPNSASVFYKTIAPTLEKLNVCSFPILPPHKRRMVEEPKSDPSTPKISYVIQGEVARLSPRFKVNLDSQQPPGSDDLSLTCQLDDKHLPCVPPLTLTIPEKYPDLPPTATLSKMEYSATDFLRTVSN